MHQGIGHMAWYPLPWTSDLEIPSPTSDIWWPICTSDERLPGVTSGGGHWSMYSMQAGGIHSTGMLCLKILFTNSQIYIYKLKTIQSLSLSPTLHHQGHFLARLLCDLMTFDLGMPCWGSQNKTWQHSSRMHTNDGSVCWGRVVSFCYWPSGISGLLLLAF